MTGAAKRYVSGLPCETTDGIPLTGVPLTGTVSTVQGLHTLDPRQIGPYALRARLGAGGMGVVYLGSDGSQDVAVKVVAPHFAGDEEFRARFRREVTLARRVAGLCTARVLDADPDAPAPYLVTEYVAGPNLAAYVRDSGPLRGELLRALAVGLAEALVAIHAAGVVHRDLKPANVLLAAAGPRVLDFGIAHAVDSTSLTRTGVVVGSPGYMSPEQTAGTSVTPATDVFSWGATLAFAATGRHPFGGPTTDVVFFRIRNDPPDLAGADEDLLPLLTAAMHKEAAARPTAVAVLGELLGSGSEPVPEAVTAVVSRAWPHLGFPTAVGTVARPRPRRRPRCPRRTRPMRPMRPNRPNRPTPTRSRSRGRSPGPCPDPEQVREPGLGLTVGTRRGGCRGGCRDSGRPGPDRIRLCWCSRWWAWWWSC